MKNFIMIAAASAIALACRSRQPENLPKDAALRPESGVRNADFDALKTLRASIDSLSSSAVCSDPAEWRIAPIGSKACGGPSGFIAYPIKFEAAVLAKTQEYTRLESELNHRRHLMSDCALETPPAGIRCENGRAVLVKSSGQQRLD